MSVVMIENGKVVMTFKDVSDETSAKKKYPYLVDKEVVTGDYPPGTLWDGEKFTTPVFEAVEEAESELQLALRDLAEDLGPQHKAKLEARLGVRKGQ